MKDEKNGRAGARGKAGTAVADARFVASVDFEVVLLHPPARVFRALATPAAISSWLLPVEAADGGGGKGETDEPRVGARWTLRPPGLSSRGERIACEITEATRGGAPGEPWRLSYTWRASGGDTENAPATTQVTWTLTPVEGDRATRLRLTHGPLTGPVAYALSGNTGLQAAPGFAFLLGRYLGGGAVAAPFFGAGAGATSFRRRPARFGTAQSGRRVLGPRRSETTKTYRTEPRRQIGRARLTTGAMNQWD